MEPTRTHASTIALCVSLTGSFVALGTRASAQTARAPEARGSAPTVGATSSPPAVVDLPAPPPPRRFRVAVEALTDFPEHVGGRVALEVPFRLRVSTSLGVMPGPYVDTINALIVAVGGYDQTTADLVALAVKNSLVWRTHVGWRPLARWGWYVDAGYGLLTLGGSVGSTEIITAATGTPPPEDDQRRGGGRLDGSILARATLHMIDFETGYEWNLGRWFTVRAGLGFAGTVGSRTLISLQDRPDPPANIQRFLDEGAAYLDTQFRAWAFTPVATVAAGVRLY